MFYLFMFLVGLVSAQEAPVYYVGQQDNTTTECFVEVTTVTDGKILEIRAILVDQHDGEEELMGPVTVNYNGNLSAYYFEDRKPQAPVKSLLLRLDGSSKEMGVEIWHGSHHHPTWCRALNLVQEDELASVEAKFSEQ